MMAELGQFALVFCLALALWQVGLAVFYAVKPPSFSHSTLLRRLSYLQLLAVLISFGALITVFAQSDFSVLLVSEHSHSAKPQIFKLSATWGNHEGSILLWLLILCGFGAWASLSFGRNGLDATVQTWTMLSQGALVAMFAAFIIWTSNPFERQFPIPFDGADLNPLLQDIGLALHPPLLYVGYVGFSILFAFAIGGLMSGRIDRQWAMAVRPFALVAWAFLTAGIAMGSWWASYELGWGGWWFWDPVENLSLMPWLTGTALVHSLLALAKRDTLRAWTVFLALSTFAASMIGTFVVRSGVLTSVHSFAVDPARGSVILAIAAISIGAAFLIFAVRAPKLSDGNTYGWLARENAIVVNNLLLCSAFGAVFIGTFYPMLGELTGGGRPSVGAPFYAATFNPMMLLLLGFMAVGPLLVWRVNMSWAKLWRPVLLLILGGLLLVLLSVMLFARFELLGLAVITIAGSVAAGGIIALSRDIAGLGGFSKLTSANLAMPLAHVGLAVSVVGMVGASLWVDEHLVALSPGERQALRGTNWQIEMQERQEIERSNHLAISVPLILTREDGVELTLAPERRFYTVREEATTELDTARDLRVHLGLTDVFATLGQPTETGRLVAKVVFRPMQILLWIGAFLMFVGGILAAFGAREQRGRRSASQ